MDELVTLGLPDWSEFSIQFTMEDQWTSFFDTCHYHLVLDPIIVRMQITKVLIDGGAGINIIFISTLNKMGLKFSSLLIPTDIPFLWNHTRQSGYAPRADHSSSNVRNTNQL
jgi:hypothetical protein